VSERAIAWPSSVATASVPRSPRPPSTVVAAAGVELDTRSFDLGAARYLRDGFVLDDPTLEELRGFDAILLGAVGPAIGDARIARGS
jgi:3-isopropylmalate dehydrogenase